MVPRQHARPIRDLACFLIEQQRKHMTHFKEDKFTIFPGLEAIAAEKTTAPNNPSSPNPIPGGVFEHLVQEVEDKTGMGLEELDFRPGKKPGLDMNMHSQSSVKDEQLIGNPKRN